MSRSENKRAAGRDDETPAFRFVHVTDPLDTRNADIRKEVRAHVTRRQHRIARLKDSSHSDVASGSRGKDVSSTTAAAAPPPLPPAVDGLDPPREHKQGAKRRRSASRLHRRHARDAASTPADHFASSNPGDLDQTSESHVHDRVDAGLQHQSRSTSRSSSIHGLVPDLMSPQALVRSAPLASKTSRMSLLNDPNDRIASMLGRLRLNFPAVMEHYQWIVGIQSVDWQAHFMPDMPPGSGYEILVPRISKDPALLATAILIAAGHLLAIRRAPMSQDTMRCIYELRDFVIHSINEAIQDPERAVSNPLLVAILIVASHEGLQGSAKNYHIHMQGLLRMINLRGGLSKLNESQPYFREYIVWQDTNVAAIMGCKPYHLLADGSAGAPTVKPDSRMWLLLDAVKK